MSKKNSVCRKFPHTSKVLVTGISAKRKSMGISQFKLSEGTGLSRNCIQQMECYEHLPRLETVFEMMLELQFSEQESKALLWDCLNAYREDKLRQMQRENELAGAI